MSLVMPSFSESSQQQKRLENERWMQFVGERTGTLRLWLQTHHFTRWADKEFIQQELQWNWLTAYRDHTYWLNFNTYSIMRFFTPTGLCRMGSQSSLDDFKQNLNISYRPWFPWYIPHCFALWCELHAVPLGLVRVASVAFPPSPQRVSSYGRHWSPVPATNSRFLAASFTIFSDFTLNTFLLLVSERYTAPVTGLVAR